LALLDQNDCAFWSFGYVLAVRPLEEAIRGAWGKLVAGEVVGDGVADMLVAGRKVVGVP